MRQSLRYSEMMRHMAIPLNLRAHHALVILEALGYDFCGDHGYMNAEEIVESKGLAEELDEAIQGLLRTRGKG